MVDKGWSRLLTNFLRLPDCLICLSRIDQAERFAWYQACLILIRQQPDRSGCRLILIWHVPDRSGSCLISGWEVVPDLPEQDFWSCSKNQAIRQTSLICEKSKVRIMVLKINFYLIHFFRACFLVKLHPNLPKYYKFNCRNNANF